MCIRDRLSAATQLNGTFAASAWLIIFMASAGFVAKAIPFGTWVAVIRIGSSVQALGRYRARSHPEQEPHPDRPGSPAHIRARCRAARQRPTILDPEWPAGARDRDRPPLPPASSRSCAARLRVVRPGISPQKPPPAPG